jgi:hypothetical protein
VESSSWRYKTITSDVSQLILNCFLVRIFSFLFVFCNFSLVWNLVWKEGEVAAGLKEKWKIVEFEIWSNDPSSDVYGTLLKLGLGYTSIVGSVGARIVYSAGLVSSSPSSYASRRIALSTNSILRMRKISLWLH